MEDIVIRNLCKSFAGKPVLRDFSAVLPGRAGDRPHGPVRGGQDHFAAYPDGAGAAGRRHHRRPCRPAAQRGLSGGPAL